MRKLKNEELNRVDVETFKGLEKVPIVIVLDNVRSMNNVGSAFRTSDAFLVDKIILCGITAQPPHRDINKTALGATESVTWEYFEETESAITYLKQQNYKIISIEQADESTMLQEFFPLADEKYAFVFGNEVFGVKDEVIDMTDIVVEIPQYGTKHSLNISVSIGVILWDYQLKSKFNLHI